MNIAYLPLEKSHLPEATKLLLDGFEDEPLVHTLGINREKLFSEIYFPEFLEKSAQQNLSIVAVDQSVGKVIGVNLVEIFRVENTPSDISPELVPYYDIFEELGLNFRAMMHTDKIVMLDSLAVNREYRGKGICQELIKQAENLAVEKNFLHSMMYATNELSQQIAVKCAYREVDSLSYDSFKHKGEALLKAIAPQHKAVKVFTKELIHEEKPSRQRD